MQINDAYREKEDLIFNFQEEFPFKLFRRCNIIKQLVLANDVLILNRRSLILHLFQNLWKRCKKSLNKISTGIFNSSEIPQFLGYPKELFAKQFCDLFSIFLNFFEAEHLQWLKNCVAHLKHRFHMELDLQSLFGFLCIQLYSLAVTLQLPLSRIWAHIRGRYWMFGAAIQPIY
jgi:hypothetical protein